MKKLAILLLLIAAPAFAEDAPATPAAAAPSPPPAPITHWTLDLDQVDLQTLNQCVMELPKRIADPFIQKMQAHLKPVEGK